MEYCRLLVVAALALLCQSRGIGACSCLPTHIQTAFCGADFVVQARILKHEVPTEVPNGMTRVFPIQVKKVYKAPVDTDLKHLSAIHTASSGASCGVYLKPRETYLVTGRIKTDGNMSTSLCDFTRQWKSMPKTQTTALKRNAINCQCKVEWCLSDCDQQEPARDTCLWQLFVDGWECYEKHGLCQQSAADGDAGLECAWEASADLSSCLEETQGKP